jgi:hypothetical protein
MESPRDVNRHRSSISRENHNQLARETRSNARRNAQTLSWISVACRLYTRWKIIYSPGWDDLAVILFLVGLGVGHEATRMLGR